MEEVVKKHNSQVTMFKSLKASASLRQAFEADLGIHGADAKITALPHLSAPLFAGGPRSFNISTTSRVPAVGT